VAGKQAAFKLSPDANSYFGKVRRNEDLSDDLLGWKARAALRAGDWKAVRRAIDAMGPERTDPTWAYWKAKAMLAGRPNAEEKAEARQLLEDTAGSQLLRAAGAGGNRPAHHRAARARTVDGAGKSRRRAAIPA
jgi:soluble lytic murein transglycosylase